MERTGSLAVDIMAGLDCVLDRLLGECSRSAALTTGDPLALSTVVAEHRSSAYKIRLQS